MPQFLTAALRGILALSFALSTPFALAAGTPKAATKASAKKVATKGPLKMLSFMEVGQLEPSRRLKYIKNLRSMAREIEKMQFMFRDSVKVEKKGSKNAGTFESKTFKDIYAFVFGYPADAQDMSEEEYEALEAQQGLTGTSGNRGRSPADRCVFGYNLTDYEKNGVANNGQRKPFECQIKPEFACEGGGVRCGAYLSGLGSGLVNDCVAKASRHIAVEICDKKREELSTKYNDDITDAFADAEKHFGFHDKKEISVEEMTNAEAKRILAELAKHAYDDRAYSQLFYVLALYKKNNIQPPVFDEKINRAYALLDPVKFEGNFNEVQSAFNEIFAEYISHCNSPVPKEEVDAILDPKWQAKFSEANQSAVAGLERIRIAAAKKYRAGQGGNKVEQITEIRECKSITARIRNMAKINNETHGSLPVVTNPTKPQPIPEPIPVREPNPRSTGCSDNVTDNEHHLFQMAAKCMVCLSDRTMAQYAKKPGLSSTEKAKYENFDTSTKWTSLLSVMALACGDGANGTQLDTPTMERYRETFGFCSGKTYEWSAEQPLTRDDKDFIETLSTQEFWSAKKRWKKNNADVDGDFKRLYGISYHAATRAFCNMDRFKKSLLNNINVVDEKYKIDYTGKDSNAARRANFAAHLDGKRKGGEIYLGEKGKDSADADVLDCMKESAKMAPEVFPADGSGASMASQSIDGSHEKNFAKMICSVNNGGGAVVYNGGRCLVATQIEKEQILDAKGKILDTGLYNIGFASPTHLVQQAEVLNVLYDGGDGEHRLPKLAFPPNQKSAHGKGKKKSTAHLPVVCAKTGTDDCEDWGNLSFLYPTNTDAESCVSSAMKPGFKRNAPDGSGEVK